MEGVPDLSSDEEVMDDDEWQEMESSTESFECLFCDKTFVEVEIALEHCLKEHKFDLEALKTKHNMDFYSYIKMINYIRSTKTEANVIMKTVKPLWSDDSFMKPVRNDSWLMFDFDSFKEDSSDEMPAFHANVENGLITLSEAHFAELQKKIESLTSQVKERDESLALVAKDMSLMRSTMSGLLNSDRFAAVPGSDSDAGLCDDSVYFKSYAHFGIHYEMLSDKVRTVSYQRAILQNDSIFKDKTVLDLGCGTAILSMFSASAGAKTVYALDQSDIVYHAMDIVRENNLQDKIKVIKGRIEKTELPSKVDVIVSEWMGYFLLFEGMLDSVIHARNKLLNPGGVLLPNRCDISIVGCGDLKAHDKIINFWSDVYGYKMNCMKSEVIQEATLDIIPQDHIITLPCKLTEIDINTCTADAMNFTSDFSLNILKDGHLTSLIGYFDTFFDLPSRVTFSTGPHCQPTHWKQTVFYFKSPYPIQKGSVVAGKITVNRCTNDPRALTVDISIFGKIFHFVLS